MENSTIDQGSAEQEMMEFLRSRKSSASLQSSPQPQANVQEQGIMRQAPPNGQAIDPNLASQLMPLAKQAASQIMGSVNAPPGALVAQGNLSWFDRNQRVDEKGMQIPIDTESGINLGEFSRMVWQRRPEDRVAVLRKMFPNNIVRQADTGEPIIEVAGPNGTRKDVLVNPVGLNAEDFLETIQGSASPTIGGAVGLFAGEAVGSRLGPGGAAVGKVLGAAIGTGIGGAIEDVTARKAEGLPLDPAEIAKEQSQQAALNALFDVGAWGAGKALRLASPFGPSKGPLQFDLEKGKQYFRDTHGIEFKTTPAEESGNPLLARIEATEAPQPGASTVLGKIYKQGQEQITRVWNAALGGRISDEELGKDIIADLKWNVVKPAEEAVRTARNALKDRGETELVDLIDSVAPSPAKIKEAGESLRQGFAAKLKLAKDLTDDAYADVRKLPGGTDKILPGNSVADVADSVFEDLPKIFNTETIKTVDSYGNPISKVVVRKQMLKSGIPEGVLSFLEDMKAQKGQLMTIDELTQLKNRARDEIAKTEAVPGVKDHWFGIIVKAYKQAIDDGLAGLPDGSLKKALENAKNTYMDKLLPFDREGLHDVLRTEFESGFQSPEQLFNRMFSGVRADHNYRMMKETLGANSVEFEKLRNALLSNWRLDAVDPLTHRIKPDVFESHMLELRSKHPEIYDDVTKGAEQKFFEITRSLKAAGKEIKDVDPDELQALLSTGSVTRSSVLNLMDKQAERDALLANSYLSDLATGKQPKQSPAQFVSSLFNSDIDSSHLVNVLSALPPSRIEAIQTAALYRISTKASEANLDMAKFLHGEQSPVQGMALAKALGPVGSLERQRNETLLGPDFESLVKNTIAVLGPREIKTGLFKAAGGMAATGLIEKLLRVPLQYASQFVKKSIIATLYTSEPVKKWLTNTVEGPAETAAFANMLIASEPFIRKLQETFGEDAAYSIVKDAKASIDKSVLQDTQPSEQDAQQAELFRFLQGQKAKAKIEARPAPIR